MSARYRLGTSRSRSPGSKSREWWYLGAKRMSSAEPSPQPGGMQLPCEGSFVALPDGITRQARAVGLEKGY